MNTPFQGKVASTEEYSGKRDSREAGKVPLHNASRT